MIVLWYADDKLKKIFKNFLGLKVSILNLVTRNVCKHSLSILAWCLLWTGIFWSAFFLEFNSKNFNFFFVFVIFFVEFLLFYFRFINLHLWCTCMLNKALFLCNMFKGPMKRKRIASNAILMKWLLVLAHDIWKEIKRDFI